MSPPVAKCLIALKVSILIFKAKICVDCEVETIAPSSIHSARSPDRKFGRLALLIPARLPNQRGGLSQDEGMLGNLRRTCHLSLTIRAPGPSRGRLVSAFEGDGIGAHRRGTGHSATIDER